MTAAAPPSRRYYQALEGRWSGPLRFEVTDHRAAGARALGVRCLGLLAAAAGPVRMSTTLVAAGDDFRHTTRVTKWGVLLLETAELITLLADGRGLRLRGEQRAPLRGPLAYQASGEIADDAASACYRIPWAGVELTQRTRVVGDVLELEQRTPFSRGRAQLRRERAAA